MRMERVEWFGNRDPFSPEIEELFDLGVFLPLKEKDNQNRQVFIIRKCSYLIFIIENVTPFLFRLLGTAVHDPKIHTQNNVLKV